MNYDDTIFPKIQDVMKIKFKKLNENAVLPSYSKPGDAGLDLTACGYERLSNNQVKFRFGWAVEIPKGYVGLIFPRSSIYRKTKRLSNSVGVIDSGYRGEVSAVFDDIKYWIDDRVAQMIIMPYPKIEPQWAEELSTTERGEGGYGSTGQ